MWWETEFLLWKALAAWSSVNAFYTGGGLWNWYVNTSIPPPGTPNDVDTFALTVDLVIAPDLTRWEWKDEDEYAHVRRLGFVTDTEHQAVDATREEALDAHRTHRRLRGRGTVGGLAVAAGLAQRLRAADAPQVLLVRFPSPSGRRRPGAAGHGA
ncbi:DUF402 domain-containing protein [Streptomyces sp. NPDC101145]|uniref:DUF402 domain-containing protein n=1 Tax=Streptomyces sp. NPDC101145 TaxID=3366112 RepID=UPI0038295B4E